MLPAHYMTPNIKNYVEQNNLGIYIRQELFVQIDFF